MTTHQLTDSTAQQRLILKFIIGIGNPGKKYEHTRHNIGFFSMDALIKHLSGSPNWKETPELKAEGEYREFMRELQEKNIKGLEKSAKLKTTHLSGF